MNGAGWIIVGAAIMIGPVAGWIAGTLLQRQRHLDELQEAYRRGFLAGKRAMEARR